MISSPPNFHHQVVCPMEGDAEIPPTPFCIPSHSKSQPHLHSPPSVTCRRRYDGKGKREASRRSGRLHVAKEQTQEKEDEQESKSIVQRRTRLNSSLTKRGRGRGTENHSRMGTQSEMTKHKTGRGGRRKMSPTTPTLLIEESITGKPQSDREPIKSEKEIEIVEPPENPSPVKGWVIGPLFQSLKSKMASFTEIVMSPVRLFKPSYSSAASGTHPDLQDLGLDNVADDHCNMESHNGHFSEKERGEGPSVERPYEAEMKNKGYPDSGLSQESGHIGEDYHGTFEAVHAEGRRENDTGCFNHPHSTSVKEQSSSMDEKKTAVQEYVPVRRLNFDTESKIKDCVQEGEYLHVAKHDSVSGTSQKREGQGDSDTCDETFSERLTESPLCRQHSPLHRTRRRSTFHLSTSKEQQASKGVRLQQLHTKCILQGDAVSHDCPRKRSPSSAIDLRTSPKKMLLTDELIGICSSKEEHTLGETSAPTALETNTSTQSSTLTSSFYCTPPESLLTETEMGDLVQPSYLEGDKENPPSPSPVFRDLGADERHRTTRDSVVTPSPSKSNFTTSDYQERVYAKGLEDDGEGSQEREGKPGKWEDHLQMQSKVLDSVQPRPALKGPHDDKPGDGAGIRVLEERWIKAQTETESGLEAHERVKPRRGGKRGKGKKKKGGDNLSELLAITTDVTQEGAQSVQNEVRKGIATTKLQDDDPHVYPGSRADSISSSLDVKDGKNNTKDMTSENTLTMSTSANASKVRSRPKNATNFNPRKLKIVSHTSADTSCMDSSANKSEQSVAGMEGSTLFPDLSTPYSERVTTETKGEEEKDVGIAASDVQIEGTGLQCSRRERQHWRSRKRNISPGVAMDPVLNEKKCITVQEKTKLNSLANVQCKLIRESQKIQASGPGNQLNVRRARLRTRTDKTIKKTREDGQDNKGPVEKERTVDMELKREGAHSGDEEKSQGEVTSEGTGMDVILHPKHPPTAETLPVRRRVGRPPKTSRQQEFNKPILDLPELQTRLYMESSTLSHICTRTSRGISETRADPSVSATEIEQSTSQNFIQNSSLVSSSSVKKGAVGEDDKLNPSPSLATGRLSETSESKDILTLCGSTMEDPSTEQEVTLSLPVQAHSRSQVQVKCTFMQNGSQGEGKEEECEEREMGSISCASSVTTVMHSLHGSEAVEEVDSGKMCPLIEKGMLRDKRSRKPKQKGRLRKGEDSHRRKGGRWLRTEYEEMEPLAKTEEQRKDISPSEDSGSGLLPTRLLRSYSCPEIPSLLLDRPLTSPLLPSSQHNRLHFSPLYRCPPVPPPPSPAKRARRHTVCSLEVEREIAPLCLRKEVYPSGRGGLYCIPSHLCPTSSASSTSLTALASCFLSSPLAFLSRKQDGSSASGGAINSSSCSHDVTVSSSNDVTPSSTSPIAPLVRHPFPGTTSCTLPRSGQSSASVSSLCSVSSQIPLGESEGKQIDEDERSCFTLKRETSEAQDEKALSDSELKVASAKKSERGKVSRIRIRKTPPKPPTNLTPMGLPRPIRLKKKEFSLEEIYTNKNFRKPPEGRLETIFEVPVSNRDGSQSLMGQRRLKRLVEFPELGVARKPRKPLSGVGTGVSRKAGGSSVFGRTRRAGSSKAKEGPSHSLEELDSLLFSKLDQLDAWIAFDQDFSV